MRCTYDDLVHRMINCGLGSINLDIIFALDATRVDNENLVISLNVIE